MPWLWLPQNNTLNQQIIRSSAREQASERRVSRQEEELARKDKEMQYWKLKSQHRQSSQKSPHSNCHTSTPSFSTTTSFPMLDTATSNITTTINNNGIIGDIANVDKDDGNGSDVMMDVVVNSNAAANVNNIVDIDDNNYNDYNAAVHVALQQLH